MSILKSPEFWQRFCDRDSEAVQKLLGIAQPMIAAACSGLNLPNALDRADVMAIVLDRVWDNLCPIRIDLSDNPDGWLKTVAWNAARRIRLVRNRIEKLENASIAKDRDTPMDMEDSNTELPEKRATQSEANQQIANCMEGLSKDFQEILALYFWQGMNWTAISELLAIPISTITTRKERALAQLRACLLASGGDFEEFRAKRI